MTYKKLVVATLSVALHVGTFWSISSNASEVGGDACAAALLHFDKEHPLRLQVQRLESGAQQDRVAVSSLQDEVETLRLELVTLRNQIGFREAYMWRWLARLLRADFSKLDAATTTESKLATLERDLDRAKTKLNESEELVVGAIRSWLLTNDSLFKSLEAQQRKFYDVVCAGRSCLKKIDQAIDDVKSAQTDDLIAALSESTLIQLIAASDTSKANSSISDAKDEVETYRRHIMQLESELKSDHGDMDGNHIEGVDPTLQLAVDFISGSGIMDLFNFFALSNARDDLSELKSKVEETHRKFEDAHIDLLTKLSGRICQTKQQCLEKFP